MIGKNIHYELIAREGYPFFVPLGVFSFLAWIAGYAWSSFIFLVLAVLVAAFFRNPDRNSPTGKGILLSPADGRVAQITENVSSERLSTFPLTRISIFMSIFNVHVNRWPASGLVKKITHVSGTFLDARHKEASLLNEHNSIVLEMEDTSIEVVQIAGKVARRIACWVEEGDRVEQGNRFGLIRFGSRLDVYLPPTYEPLVRVGNKTSAGVTIIARRKPAASETKPLD